MEKKDLLAVVAVLEEEAIEQLRRRATQEVYTAVHEALDFYIQKGPLRDLDHQTVVAISARSALDASARIRKL